MGLRKITGCSAPIQSLVKLQSWFLSLRWKTCLQQNCSLDSGTCSEVPALGRNILMMMMVMIFYCIIIYKSSILRYYNNIVASYGVNPGSIPGQFNFMAIFFYFNTFNLILTSYNCRMIWQGEPGPPGPPSESAPGCDVGKATEGLENEQLPLLHLRHS